MTYISYYVNLSYFRKTVFLKKVLILLLLLLCHNSTRFFMVLQHIGTFIVIPVEIKSDLQVDITVSVLRFTVST